MKFGQSDNPEVIDFTLPTDNADTDRILKKGKGKFNLYVGCAKWNKQDLKNFYPRGTKDELTYYATQFNSIELNATFYNMPSKQQVETWKNKVPDNFKFFPKITNSISHFKRLVDVKTSVDEYCDAVSLFGEKLGMVFLQMHDNFKPKDFERVEKFVREFPKGIPLAIELRNTEWFNDEKAASAYYQLLEENNITNIVVDTASRRDMLHMRLTTPTAFIRYVGANHPSDYTRLDDWLVKVKQWKESGLDNLYFFVHQNIEEASPLLSAYFIKNLNKELNLNHQIPVTL